MKFRKEAVRSVVTVNIGTLSGLPSSADSDDVSLVASDRVLLIAQTDPAENGLWEVATGAWSRPSDSATATNIRSRSIVFVEEGTKYEGAGFVLQTLGTIVVDTDPQTWFCYTLTSLPPGWINVQDFGAVGDATTENSVAFAAAFQGFPGVYTPGETELDGTLYVPPGTYNLSENLWVTRGVRFLGAGGFGDFGTHLKFAAYKGIYVVGYGNGPEAQDAQGAIIEALHIQGGHAPGTDDAFPKHRKWLAEEPYTNQKIVEAMPRDWTDADRKYQSVDRYFECISPGTSGATEPRWEAVVDGMTNGVDDAPSLSAWAENTAYDFNSFVWVPNRFDIVFMPLDFIEEEFSGTSSAAMEGAALGDEVSDGNIMWKAITARNYFRGDTIDDPTEAAGEGQPVWVARKNAGIRVLRRCKIIDCTIRNFLNAGIDLACSSSYSRPSYSIGTQVVNVQIRQCGGGVRTQFNDSGACLFQGLDVQGSVDHAGGHDITREFGILDRGQFGSTYVGSQLAEVGGPAIFQDRGNSVFLNNYTEGDCGASILISGDAMLLGGLNTPTVDSSVQGILARGDWRGVGEKLLVGSNQGGPAKIVLADPALGFSGLSLETALPDGSGGCGWVFNLGGGCKWSLVGDGNAEKPAIHLTTMRSPNTTSYMVSLPRGYFVGQDTAHETLVTTGGSTVYDYNIRGGKRVVGDRDIDATLIKPNSFLETVVIENGFRGDSVWTDSSAVNTFNRAITYMQNDKCLERNGYVYRCVNTGVTGTSEPAWPTTPTPYPGIQVWNGGFNNEPAFGGCYKEGDIVRPTMPNGFVYICHAAPEGPLGVHEGHVGGMEPLWETTLGEFNTDGDLTWKCHAVDDDSSFVDDGTAVWVCQGKLPTYGKANFIHNEGSAILSAGVGPITGAIDLGPIRNDEINVYRVTVKAQNVTEQTYAYFELTATWAANGDELEPPDVASTYASTGATTWSAELNLNGDRVEVLLAQDGAADVKFTAIRAIF